MERKSRPDDELDPPIAFRAPSNGEHAPAEETEADRRALATWRGLVDRGARRTGMTRRQFVESACGSAAVLLAMNQVYGCGGSSAVYDLPADAGEDLPLACDRLEGDEFIFDVQIHPPSPLTPWRPDPLPTDAETLLRILFVASDTTVGCLSGIPGARAGGQNNVEANRQLRELMERAVGPRLIIHANVDPTRGASELDYMADVAARFPIAAWKVYPHVGPWRLDQGVGLAFLERARALGTKVIAAHRGIGPGVDYGAASSPIDLVNAARMFPDLSFLCYHSGWDSAAAEDHAFDPAQANPTGIDRLVKAVRDVGTTGNIYAELGSTWRNLMTAPASAAHGLGKLLATLGDDHVTWGTDSVFTGSPQEQIVAFRAFQIPAQLREEHGYPEITAAVRRNVFGLNAARVYGVDPQAARCVLAEDDLAKLKQARKADPRSVAVPRTGGYGPRSRREFLRFLYLEQA